MSDDAAAPLPIDPMLQMFVGIMVDAGVQLSVSVIVGGVWLSGTLISPRMYTQELGDEIAARAGQPGEALRGFFAEVGRQWFPSDSERAAADEEQAEESPAPMPRHLHLRHARSFFGDTPVPRDGHYVRVRLDQVAGWTIGALGSPGYYPPEPPVPAG